MSTKLLWVGRDRIRHTMGKSTPETFLRKQRWKDAAFVAIVSLALLSLCAAFAWGMNRVYDQLVRDFGTRCECECPGGGKDPQSVATGSVTP